MEVIDRTKEYKEFEDSVAFGKKIDDLSQERAAFVLQVLLASGRLSRDMIQRSMDLADSVGVY